MICPVFGSVPRALWDCMLPEIRMARIVEAIGRYRCGELSCLEAAEVLGMSELHIRRLRDRYEADGAAGIVDRRLGRAYHGRRRRTGLPRCSKNTGPGTGISRRSIFMNTWCAATALNMATPGPKPLCSGPTWCPMHRAGGGIATLAPAAPTGHAGVSGWLAIPLACRPWL